MPISRYITEYNTGVMLTFIGENSLEDILFAYSDAFHHPRVSPHTILAVNAILCQGVTPRILIAVAECIIEHKHRIAPYIIRLIPNEYHGTAAPMAELLEHAGFTVGTFLIHELGQAYEFMAKATLELSGVDSQALYNCLQDSTNQRLKMH